ncbi:MAG TPA: ammonia-forming cytochrome c nitrite reductase subunit c552, partial [Solimonas sp.]
RWFHLYPTDQSLSHADVNAQAIKAGDPLHWTGTYFNWNSRCASCHSTNLRKKYDAKADRYDTRWSEINVACESCHGPGAKHLVWAKSTNKDDDPGRGLSVSLTNTAQWKFVAAQPPLSDIKRRVSAENQQQPQVCAQCHSRRQELAQWNPATSFADQNQIRLLEPGLYAADGQMQEEVYVYGSFLQSKMHQNGVVCSDCHNPHSLKLKLPGNATCTQCHRASVFDTSAHSHHKPGSDGAQCVNCHMPTVTYMGVDARRDHSFRLPRPLLEANTGSADACRSCHRDQTASWAQKAIDSWALPAPRPSDAEHFANAFHAVDQGLASDSSALVTIATDNGLADIVRGSAALRLGNVPDRKAMQEIGSLLHDKSWLMRLGAVRATESFPTPIKWQLLQPQLDEPVAAVRYVLAEQLAGVPLQDLPARDQARLQVLFAEYLQRLAFTIDIPESLASRARFELARNEPAAAEQDLLAALRLAPKLEGALLNLADLYRVTGRDDLGEPLLQRAAAAYPDSAYAHYAFGLWQVRHQQLRDALVSIDTARQLDPRDPQFTLATALLLEQIPQRRTDAVAALRQWQAQYGDNTQMQDVVRRLQSDVH